MKLLRSAVLLALVAACLSCGKEEYCHGEGCTGGVDPDPSPIPTGGSFESIYQDALASNWQTLAPFNSCAIELKGVTGRTGTTTAAVHATAAGDFAGFWLVRSAGPDWGLPWYPAAIGDYRSFRAWMRFAQTAQLPDLKLYLGDGANGIGTAVGLSAYLPASPEANRWYELVIPMDDFQATPGQTFVGINYQFGEHSVDLYLDDVRLELAD